MMARLSRHTLLLLASNVGGAGLSFALSVVIGRALGREGLGVYAVVLAWVYPLSLLVEFGLATLATRDIAQDNEQSTGYLHAMARARLLLGGLVMLGLILLAPALTDEAEAAAGLVVSAPLVVILPFYSAFTAVFKARGAMWPIPWLNIGMLAAQLALTLGALLSGGGVLAALIINTLTSLGQLIAAWAVWRWRFYLPLARPAPTFGLLVRRAWPFALAALFAALQVRLSILLLENMTSTGEVGAFAAASRLVEGVRMIPNALFGALFPALAALAARPLVLRQTFRRAMLGLGLFGLVAVVAALFLAPWLIDMTYGEAFAPAVPMLQVLMISLAFSLLRGGRTLYWYARGREQWVNVVNGLAVALQLLLSLLLIPSLGGQGAAVALVAVEALAWVFLWRDVTLPQIKVPEYDRL